ncbi:MAG: hypothetical protein M1826_004474 [Phylliscum demangeonii]|nr:MAG: hypothetical protein M1826_004474 [Phylliscum demangeonii]
MEAPNVQKAAQYVNNLLLSRGLLRNGQAIDFLSPTAAAAAAAGTDAPPSDGGASAKIINLVHDLILRRDRDLEHQEQLGTTIASLRQAEKQNKHEAERVVVHNAELQRQLATAHGHEDALKATVRTAEEAGRALRDESQRVKNTLKQVREQAALDARLHEMEIGRLKTMLNAKQRGMRVPLANTTRLATQVSTRTPARLGSAVDVAERPRKRRKENEAEDEDEDEGEAAGSGSGPTPAPAPSLNSPHYHLSQESSQFLAQLCQSLGEENDGLMGLIRSCLARLRALRGLRHARTAAKGSEVEVEVEVRHGEIPDAGPTSFEALQAQMDRALDHLHTILTNPSFVPLEEVQVREDEIARLRLGWEKMERRWKEAVAVMDGWGRRIADDGTLVDHYYDEEEEKEKEEEETDLGPLRSPERRTSARCQSRSRHASPRKSNGAKLAWDDPAPNTGVERRPGPGRGGVDARAPRELSLLQARASGDRPTKAGLGAREGEEEDVADAAIGGSSTRHPSSKLRTSSSIPRLAKATIEQKLDSVHAEAQAAHAPGPEDEHPGELKPVVRRPGRPRKKRTTLSPEELDYLLGVTS